MSDFFYLVYKVGDAPNGILDGMPICYIDPDDYPDISDYEKTFSYHMKTVFLIVKLNKIKLPIVKDQLFGNDNGKKRKSKINFRKLGFEIGNANLENQLRSKNKVEVIDCTNVEDSILFDDLNNNNRHVFDFNAISSGTYTIGTGGDYATIMLYAADVTHQTGDLLAIIISSTTESGASVFNHNLGGFNFTITSNLYSNINILTGTNYLIQCDIKQTGNIIFSYLNLKRTTAADLDARTLIILYGMDASNVTISNCIFNGNSLQGGGIDVEDNSPICHIYNNIFLGHSNAGSTGLIIFAGRGNASNIYENNSVYDCDTGIAVRNNAGSFLNNAVFANVTAFSDIVNATGSNNACSDASGADGNWGIGLNNQTNLVAVNEFQSLISTEFDFLLPVKGGNLYSLGTNPTIMDHTIYYNLFIIVLGDVDIGAKGLSRGSLVSALFYKHW